MKRISEHTVVTSSNAGNIGQFTQLNFHTVT